MTVAPAMMSDVTWVAVDSDCPSATINMETNDAMESQNLRLVSLRFQSILFIVKPSLSCLLGKIKHGLLPCILKPVFHRKLLVEIPKIMCVLADDTVGDMFFLYIPLVFFS